MKTSQIALLVALVCLLWVGSCDCPPPADCPRYAGDYTLGATEFDAAAAHAHIDYLAHDDREGRLAGNADAAEYIHDRFEEYGLVSPPGLEDYYQVFTSPVTRRLVEPLLAIVDPGESDTRTHQLFTAEEEFVPHIGMFLGSGDVTGEVVWLGGCFSEDFDSNLSGKIVLCAPMSSETRQRAFPLALHYGIAGMLEIHENDGPSGRSAYGFCSMIDMPAFRIGPAVVSAILAESPYGQGDLNQIEVPTPLGVFMRMKASFDRVYVDAHNVLGVIPGSDPLIGDEVVIIGAHFDGPGTDPDGTIYNAANDNASGVAVMLEIAHMWYVQGVSPARTVVFAAWDGEEQFTQGSSHYLDPTPLFPLEQTVVYLNLDAVGVGEVLSIYRQDTPANELADHLQAGADWFDIEYHVIADRLSDDMPFNVAGVTAAGLMVVMDDLQYYPQLHRPDDDTDIIDDDVLRMVGILAAYSLFSWAMGR